MRLLSTQSFAGTRPVQQGEAMPPARKSATRKPATRASRATQGVRARAASTTAGDAAGGGAVDRPVREAARRRQRCAQGARRSPRSRVAAQLQGSDRCAGGAPSRSGEDQQAGAQGLRQAAAALTQKLSREDVVARRRSRRPRPRRRRPAPSAPARAPPLPARHPRARPAAARPPAARRRPLHLIALDLVTSDGHAFEINAREEDQLAHALEPCAQGSSVVPASIRVGSSASSSTAPRTRTPSPNVTSPCTTSRSRLAQ